MRLLDCACVSHLPLRQAELIAGVTHSYPYLTVGLGWHEATRDSGTNGNLAVFDCVPRRRSTSFPWAPSIHTRSSSRDEGGSLSSSWARARGNHAFSNPPSSRISKSREQRRA